MGATRQSLYKLNSKQERRAKTALSAIDTIGAINFSAWFVALSNISVKLNKFFRDNQNYFFSVSILLSILHWILTLHKYLNAPNKNIKNTANIVYKTFNIAVYASIIAAFLIGGAAAGATAYYIFCLVDPVYNLVKAGFYFIQMLRADSIEEKEFFYNKCQKSVKWACVLGLLTLGMLALWLIPGLPLALTIAVGAIGAVASLAMIGVPVAKKFGWLGDDEKSLKKGLVVEDEYKHGATNDLLMGVGGHNIVWTNKFYKSIHIKKLSKEALAEKLNKKINKFETEIKNTVESPLHLLGMFSEKDKWQDKKRALSFLKALLDALETRKQVVDGAISKVSFSYPGMKYGFAGVEIEYSSTEDLFKKAINRVMQDHPRAFQSWHKKCSAVLKCFHQANLMLQDKEQNLAGNAQAPALSLSGGCQ